MSSKFCVETNVGVVREENQDRAAIFEKDDQILVVLCDGMGGHFGGSHASTITINTFEKEFNKGVNVTKISGWFEDVINKCRKEMINFSNKNKKLLDMGTTLTAALIIGEKIYVFNIGDSRTYAYNGVLHQITEDHNLRNYYIAKYDYSAEEAAKIVGAAALTSALGPDKNVQVDSLVIEKSDVKLLILTSDGIHDYISKPRFETILGEDTTLKEKADELIKSAINGKSSDNLTVAMVNLEEQKW